VSNKRILAVDDEISLLTFIDDFLSRYDFSVTTCTDASKAIDMIKSDANRFDLIITDQTMPGMTGLELISELKKLKNNIPVILCSGYNDVIDESEIKNHDVSFYLQKPVGNALLLKCIEQLLA